MTIIEKIEKVISLQRHLSDVEFNISGDKVFFTRPNESAKYRQVGSVRISDGKAMPAFGIKARTSRDHDAQKFLNAISDGLKEVFPEDPANDTRPLFKIEW